VGRHENKGVNVFLYYAKDICQALNVAATLLILGKHSQIMGGEGYSEIKREQGIGGGSNPRVGIFKCDGYAGTGCRAGRLGGKIQQSLGKLISGVIPVVKFVIFWFTTLAWGVSHWIGKLPRRIS